jgi:hypothetical protein
METFIDWLEFLYYCLCSQLYSTIISLMHFSNMLCASFLRIAMLYFTFQLRKGKKNFAFDHIWNQGVVKVVGWCVHSPLTTLMLVWFTVVEAYISWLVLSLTSRVFLQVISIPSKFQIPFSNSNSNLDFRTIKQILFETFLTHGYSVGVFGSLCYHFDHIKIHSIQQFSTELQYNLGFREGS